MNRLILIMLPFIFINSFITQAQNKYNVYCNGTAEIESYIGHFIGLNRSIKNSCFGNYNDTGIGGLGVDDLTSKYLQINGHIDCSSVYGAECEDGDPYFVDLFNLNELEFGKLYTYVFNQVSISGICYQDEFNVKINLTYGISPPTPDKILNSNGQTMLPFIEGDPISLTTKSGSIIKFPDNSTLFDYQIEFRANTGDTWKPISTTVPAYSTLTDPTTNGRKIYLRSRIYRKDGTDPVKYSSYYIWDNEVRPKVNADITAVGDLTCNTDQANITVQIGDIQVGHWIDMYANGTKRTTFTATGTYYIPFSIGTYTIDFDYIRNNELLTSKIGIIKEIKLKSFLPLTLTANIQNPILCSGGTGKISLTPSGGSGVGYTYSVDGTNYVISNVFTLSSGTYTFRVQDCNNTVAISNSVTLQDPPILSLGTPTITDVTCKNGTDGKIAIAASGGTGTNAYRLYKNSVYDQANGTGVFSNLSQSNYTVYVSNNCPEISRSNINVNEPATLTLNAPTIKPVTCNGGNDGAITIAASGGTGNYKYTLTPGNIVKTDNKAITFDALVAGDYAITVVNLNGSCSEVKSSAISITQPATAVKMSINSSTNVSCFSGSDASVTITASDGTSPYKYSKDGTTWQTGNIFNGLPAGSFTFFVKDNNECTINKPQIITQPLSAVGLSISPINVSCNGGNNGSVTLSASGGTSPYQYKHDGANWQAQNVFNNLSAGTYSFYVKDNNGCQKNLDQKISEPTNPLAITTSQVDVDCYNAGDGSITINASGGTKPYQFSKDNGTTFTAPTMNSSYSFTNLNAGDYKLVLKDNNGCDLKFALSINQPNVALSATVDKEDVTCFGAGNGIIKIHVAGGTDPYQFSKDDGATFTGSTFNSSNTFSGLAPGVYYIIVKDKNGCNTRNPITIAQPNPLSATVSKVDVICFNAGNGSITVNATGGTAPYLYSKDNGSNFISSAVNPYAFLNLGPSNYNVVIKDSKGCQYSYAPIVTITQPPSYTLDVTSWENVKCPGGVDGSVALKVTGGTSPYSFRQDGNTWTSASATPTYTFEDLVSNNYKFSVIDGLGCTSDVSQLVSQPNPISSSETITNVKCKGENSGKLRVDVSGGTSPYSLELTKLNVTVYSEINVTQPIDFNNLTAGDYHLNITDAHNCTNSFDYKILEPNFSLGLNVTESHDPKCYGSSNGSIQLNATNGWGKHSYTYTLLPAGPSNSTGLFSGLSKGSYNFSVTDSLGCSTETSQSLNQPSLLEISTKTIDNLKCNGVNIGGIVVTAKGGTKDYSFKLTGNGISEINSADSIFSNLPAADNYTITVTDHNNCTAFTNAVITQPTPLGLSINKGNYNGFNIKCFNGTDTVRVIPNGGTPPYVITFKGQTLGCPVGGYTLNDLAQGGYSITVTDFNNCSYTTTFNLIEPTLFTLDAIDVDSTLCNGTSTGAVTIAMKGGVSSYTFNLLDSQNNLTTQGGVVSHSFTGLSSGSYNFSSTDQNGCGFIKPIIVYQPDPVKINFETTNVICYGGNSGKSEAKIQGGTTPYTYSWIGESNAVISTTPMISEAKEYDYHFLFTDKNGCSSGKGKMGTLDTLVRISNPAQPLSVSANISKVLCYGESTGKINLIGAGGWSGYSYSINNGAFNSDTAISGLTAGVDSVKIKDLLGCVVKKGFTVEENPQLVFSANKFDASCFGGENGRIQLITTGGSPNYKYFINNLIFSGDTTKLIAGDYTLYVSDMYNCQAQPQSISIGSPMQINYTAAVINSNCNISNGSIDVTPSGGTLPYTVEWTKDNVVYSSGTKLSNQPSGIYDFRITDGHSCQRDFEHSISDDGSPAITLNSMIDTYCPSGSDGKINLSVDQGMLPYNVYLLNGSTELDSRNLATKPSVVEFNGLRADTLTIKVVDGNNCQSIEQYVIKSPLAITAAVTTRNISCISSTNGTAILALNGGTSPYQVKWINSSNQELVSTGNIENLPAGSYTYKVTDSHNCSYIPAVAGVSNSFSINAPSAPLSVSINAVFNVLCYQGQDGEVRLTPQGGWGNYKFSIDLGANWVQNPNFSSLKAGDYRFLLADNLDCIDTVDTKVNDGIPVIVNVDALAQVKCFGTNTGSLTLSASGGGGNYSYSINDGLSYTANHYFISLPFGDYKLWAKDLNGCLGSLNQKIDQPTLLEAAIDRVANTACYKSIGSALVKVSGGTLPYSYRWSDGQLQSEAIKLPLGTYNVDVIDKNGCVAKTSVKIENLPGPRITLLSKSDVTCSYFANGSIATSLSSGTLPLAMVWKGINSNSTNLNNLNKGIYTAVATDYYGCRDSVTISIAKPDSLMILLQKKLDPLCYAYSNGILDVALSGGTTPYRYLWSNGSQVSTTGDIPSGSYDLKVTDGNGCEANASYSLIDPPSVKPNLLAQKTICSNQTFDVDAGMPNATDYFWFSENGFTSKDRKTTLSVAGDYYLLVTDRNGCAGKDTLTLIKDGGIVDANFLMVEKAAVGDTIVAIEMSWPVPEAIEWVYPAAFREIFKTDYSIYLIPQMTGTFNIGLNSYLGICSQYIDKPIIIEEASTGNKKIATKQALIREVAVFPNPTSGEFSVAIDLNKEYEATVEIYSVYGNRLFSKRVSGLATYKVDVNLFQLPGIYLVRITAGDENRSMRIVVN